MVDPGFVARLEGLLRPLFLAHCMMPREKLLIVAIAAGLTNRQMVEWTGWSEATIETYLKLLYSKLRVSSRGQVSRIVLNTALVALEQSASPRRESTLRQSEQA